MYKTFKLDRKNQEIYFWACTHIFHKCEHWEIPLWKIRGYESALDHANGIRNKINKICNTGSLLFILGDGFLSSTVEEVEGFLSSLSPSIAYIYGNHESSVFKIYRREVDNYIKNNMIEPNIEIYPFTYKNITFLGNQVETEIKLLDGRKCNFVLNHFPLKVFNNAARNFCHLHSHNHGSLKSSWPNAQEGKILEVSVDVFPDGPVSVEQVMKIMDKKLHKKFDSHH